MPPRGRVLGLLGLLAGFCLLSPLQLGFVLGPSMDPTMRDGSAYLLDRGYYETRPLKRGDVVVFKRDGTTYVKRVLAVGGDTVYLLGQRGDRDKVLIARCQLANYQRLMHSRIAAARALRVVAYRVPAECCFVVGDNLDESMDSRQLGPIQASEILGHVVAAPPPAPGLGRLAVIPGAESPS